MASNPDFVAFVAEQLGGAGEITYRKMFGEYGLYCDGKFFGTVEGDQLYIKTTRAGQAFAPDAPLVSPHEGSHMLLIEEIDDREFLSELLRRTYAELPAPKPRRKKKEQA